MNQIGADIAGEEIPSVLVRELFAGINGAAGCRSEESAFHFCGRVQRPNTIEPQFSVTLLAHLAPNLPPMLRRG